jgi:hypothetical protein
MTAPEHLLVIRGRRVMLVGICQGLWSRMLGYSNFVRVMEQKSIRHCGTTPAYATDTTLCAKLPQLFHVREWNFEAVWAIDCEWGVDQKFFHFTSRTLARVKRAALPPKAVRDNASPACWWGFKREPKQPSHKGTRMGGEALLEVPESPL